MGTELSVTFGPLVEFEGGGGLGGGSEAGCDAGLVVVFATDLGTRQTAHHRDLTNMSEGIGDGALEELFRSGTQCFVSGQVSVESSKRREETVCVGGP